MTVAPLVIACGALASELRAVLKAQGLGRRSRSPTCRPTCTTAPSASFPSSTPLLDQAAAQGRAVFVAYADCGTGGALDTLLERHPEATRLPGSHCYEFFSGAEQFAAMHEEELGTLFLTDFLAKHFEPLLWQGLGLDRHPQLRDMYFGNYTRVVLISQTTNESIVDLGRAAAERLGLAFEHRHVGLEPFTTSIQHGVAVSLTKRVA